MFLDANALAADYRLRSPSMRILLRRNQDDLDTVIIPTVVLAEAVSTYGRQYREAMTVLKKGVRQLARLRTDLEDFGLPEQLDELGSPDGYEAWLVDRLAEHEVTFREPPKDVIPGLIRRATDRTAPFDSNGNGFRDALVWMTFLDYLVGTHPAGEVAFISNDLRAFWTDKGLHRDLVLELQAAGIPSGQVTIYDSVPGFVTSRIADEPEVHNRVVEALDEDFAQLVVDLEVLLNGQVLDISGAFGEGVVLGFTGQPRAIVDQVGSSDVGGEYLVTILLEAGIRVEVDGFDPNQDQYLSGEWTVDRIVPVSGVWRTGVDKLEHLTIGQIDALHSDEGVF